MLGPYILVYNGNVYYFTVGRFITITDHFFSLLRVTLIKFTFIDSVWVLVFNQIIYHIHKETEGSK